MAFSQSSVGSVRVLADGPDLLIDWSSTEPEGSVFQVYVDRRLSWFGASRRCHVPSPSGSVGRNVWVDVGTVSAEESTRDFSGELGSLSVGAGVVHLSWLGGSYLDPSGGDDVLGFRIYQSAVPGGPVETSVPVATVQAYPGGWVSDGFGLGGFGEGGFGRSAGRYSWESRHIPPGDWRFRIVPFDRSGTDRGLGQDVVATVRSAPRPPARDPHHDTMTYEYSGPESRRVTLRWRPSPSA